MLGGIPARMVNRFVFIPAANLAMEEDEEPVCDAIVFIYCASPEDFGQDGTSIKRRFMVLA
jgi:hypothetical protein